MPDDTLLSMPIPSDDDKEKYCDLEYKGIKYSDLLNQLKPKNGLNHCHVDPDIRDNSMDINQLSRRIRHYTLSRSENRFCKSDLFDICDGINSVLLEWTGCNYVGERKEKEKIYQDFFTSLSDLLAFYEGNREKISDIEQSFVDLLVYRGVVYRYLGIADIANASTQQIVKPEYNDIYVSWSKSTECYGYIRQKVYGPITRMQALIGGPLFGIDIHGFEDWCEIWKGKSSFITRGNEREIVFPTIEYCITEVKYLDCIK